MCGYQRAAVALVFVAALAGCTSGPAQCTAIPVALTLPPAMISPAPGATGLPTTVTVEITYDPPAGSLRAVAQGGAATTVDGTPFTAAATASPTPPPGAVDSTLSALAPHTTYDVYVDAVYPPAHPCDFNGHAGATTFSVGTISTT